MGLALALAGCALFVAGLVLAVLWLIPSFRSRHPQLGRSAIGGIILGFLLFLTGGSIISKSERTRERSQTSRDEVPSVPDRSSSPIRVPPD